MNVWWGYSPFVGCGNGLDQQAVMQGAQLAANLSAMRALSPEEMAQLSFVNARQAQAYVPTWRKVPDWYAGWSALMAGEPLCNP